MRFASRLRDRYVPERHRALATELFKFAAVGGINTVIDFALVNALLFIGPLKAKIVAAVVATTVSYVLNRQWTYAKNDKSSVRREYVLFFALNGVGLLIQEAVLAFAKYGLHFSETAPGDRLAFNIANAAGIGLAMVFRFWAYRNWVFKTPEAKNTEEAVIAELEAVYAEPPAPAPRQPEPAETPAVQH